MDLIRLVYKAVFNPKTFSIEVTPAARAEKKVAQKLYLNRFAKACL